MIKNFVIYTLIALVLYITIRQVLKHNKYYDYFHKELGYGTTLLDKFKPSELKDSYIYLTQFTRAGLPLTAENNPDFYKRILAINNKFHIFSSI